MLMRIYRKIFPYISSIIFFALLVCCSGCKSAPPVPPGVRPTPPVEAPSPEIAVEPLPGLLVREDRCLDNLDAVGRQAIATGATPGAVILVGYRGVVAYRRAFGHRTLVPHMTPMTPEVIFDLASLTKVVATTTAIMQLADQGRLYLNAPAARYWPQFAAQGKGQITIRQLLTHTSGLRADVNPRLSWSGYDGALAAIAADAPVNHPGTAYHYSDANFIVLGEIVRRVSGLSLDGYCTQKIFRPLGLHHTFFRPRRDQAALIAPTDLRWGEVHDPTAYRMGGVAGHAGLFSTADDLAVFAQMLLSGGEYKGRRLLSRTAVAAMITPQVVPGNASRRGLGWDMRSPFSRAFTASFPSGSFGHTGFTGTSIWIDPDSKTFLIILTNRLHPNGRGQVKTLRTNAAAAVAAALRLGQPAASYGSKGVSTMTGQGQSDFPDRVRTGIEVLASQGFAPLVGKTIGLITNHTGVDGTGRPTRLLLHQAPGVRLRVIFSPEHGLGGDLDAKVSSGQDPATGLPVRSLYGEVKRPTPGMLQGLDALVYDVQDVGVRFYTYITTLAYCMEAAAALDLDFYILDRPNPITAAVVQGPVLAPGLRSFVGYHPLPIRYGLTVGELARLFNRENKLGVKLHVVPMANYGRQMWYDRTGLPWVNPSPNLRSLTQAILYPGVALVESANVSVGRGTDTPFEIIGAPWINGARLTRYLGGRQIVGVAFEPTEFIPRTNRCRGQRCEGIRLRLTDRDALDSPLLGIELAAALHRLYPDRFQLDCNLGMIGSQNVLAAIKNSVDPVEIRRGWQHDLDNFICQRKRYLLY
ncbi:MAG TPA: serine hydrolase [Desulfobacterales bacterium]|nr:serine hydrolase [Desulfobacterales bacterium]